MTSSIATCALFLTVVPWFNNWSKSPLSTEAATRYVAIVGVSHMLSQIGLALTTIMRAANRYDLVTIATTPLAFLAGLSACILVPVFPSLTTVALVTLVSSAVGLAASAWLALRAIPVIRRPLLGFGEMPGLVRYGSWLLLGNVFASFTAGVDELVITGVCGSAAVPPWAIGKRLWVTIHTFLAQHIEHLVPLFGSLHGHEDARVQRISQAMHWYVINVGCAAFSLMAWSGEAIVGIVAGHQIAELCRPAISSFSMYGLGFALLVVPVTLALAKGVSRASFEVIAVQQVTLLGSLWLFATTLGSPALYYSPVVATAVLIFALFLFTAMRIEHSRPITTWVQPVGWPLTIGTFAIGAAFAWPWPLSGLWMVPVGGFVAVGVLASTLMLERLSGKNAHCHLQLQSIIYQGLGRTGGLLRMIPGVVQRRRS
jgi:O-antigen/teichoic acid export membrane protein